MTPKVTGCFIYLVLVLPLRANVGDFVLILLAEFVLIFPIPLAEIKMLLFRMYCTYSYIFCVNSKYIYQLLTLRTWSTAHLQMFLIPKADVYDDVADVVSEFAGILLDDS